ncbi:L-ascorbate metabolism protein UlaG (beta-lactamase superfamily) [Halopolyspora algeriensis]|uniref:L-ascorbate metabolism protein UlaG (Beta-lactamase superfamily) n=1 Tax=Halopolyspora algeriensis TaxID=1500506 RepID=A0A368VS71_9ACTN|nr:MBL fold metallo-hydrolase [Halopolyspora algeriensis]RCW44591.1 L-ascorbate metabolism protein UlaG (beta-lactamase superfamily) [Halopolyspora algeriensis]TQM55952.1 L-ascorbate metabolism protein UlaG (beta-lactamase superfamily) [Halopolyspora algeriensis]
MNTTIELPQRETEDFDQGEVYFIGNATTLIRYAGFTILTDPTFLHRGEHVHLGHGTYARREVEPACQIGDLGELDLIVLSHHHGDHFDDVAARELDKDIPIVTNEHAVQQLTEQGFTSGYALDTWESQEVVRGDASLRITSMPGKHAPDHVAGLLPPVMGSMLDFHQGDDHRFRLYITGDTLLHERLYDIPRWYPDIDLALVHAGGTTLLGTVVTMTGQQAVRAVEIVHPREAIPIHYNDYSVFQSGLDDLRQAAGESSVDTEFHYLTHGESHFFRRSER